MVAHESAQPAIVAYVLEQVANHPACVIEFKTKSEAQTRCPQTWYKIAISILMSNREDELAIEFWKRATAPQADFTTRIMWPSVLQTPTIWLNTLRSSEFWDCSSWPFVQELESSSSRILQEVHGIQTRFAAAYPYLSQNGDWQNLFLFRANQWNASLCRAMPWTCNHLIPELPTKPEVPYMSENNEEVVIFRSQPGTSVGPHCGASNNQVNIHLTLTGASSTVLRVGEHRVQLQDGHAICFQDSFVHAIEHTGSMERISLVMRVMHPEMKHRVWIRRSD